MAGLTRESKFILLFLWMLHVCFIGHAAEKCGYKFNFPTLNGSVFKAEENVAFTLPFSLQSDCDNLDGLNIKIARQFQIVVVFCHIRHEGGNCHVAEENCKCSEEKGKYHLTKIAELADNTTWIWWVNRDTDRGEKVSFDIRASTEEVGSPRQIEQSNHPATSESASNTLTSELRTSPQPPDPSTSAFPSQSAIPTTRLHSTAQQLDTSSSANLEDNKKTTMGEIIAAAVVAGLVMASVGVAVFVVYKLMKRKHDQEGRCPECRPAREGHADATDTAMVAHDPLHEDYVMIENTAGNNATAEPEGAQGVLTANHDYEDIATRLSLVNPSNQPYDRLRLHATATRALSASLEAVPSGSNDCVPVTKTHYVANKRVKRETQL